jgi:S-adenosylmethionine hydrolase
MQRPIITLTTDFGQQDHYVGAMKGVILTLCPEAQLVDISHEIPPFSVPAAAYAIDQAAPFFPRATVHVVVIDPGVGTERKPLLVAASNQFFVAPDNGVLSFILRRDRKAQAWEIQNSKLRLPKVSATFHGRDIFAVTAAAIAAAAVKPEEAGNVVSEPVMHVDLEPHTLGTNAWQGSVLSVDHFGNIVTNFASADFQQFLEGTFSLSAGTGTVTTLRNSFGGAPAGLCFAYTGSSGFIELALNQGSAAAHLGIRAGDSIRLQIGN